MALKEFPKLPGPTPFIWWLAVFVVSAGIFTAFPTAGIYLGLNLINIFLLLFIVVRGQPWTTKVDRGFLLSSALVILLALYGTYRGFGRLDILYSQLFFLLPASAIYFAVRFHAYHYAWLLAMDHASTLGPEAKMDFAETCRTKYRKKLAALPAAAEIYKTVAKEALEKGADIKPYHIKAMQKYAHMLLYGEAKGLMNEGEWFAKKAQQFSIQMLVRGEVEAEATMH